VTKQQTSAETATDNDPARQRVDHKIKRINSTTESS